MKFVFLVLLTSGGTIGALIRGPFLPLLVYYFFGVFRPQFLWEWELVNYPSMPWSFILALAIIITYLPWVFGVVGPLNDPLRRVFPAFIWPHRFMLLFGAWMTLSYLFANDQYAAWSVYWDFLKILLIYLVSTQVVRSVGQVWVTYMMVTASLAYIAVDVNHEYIRSSYLVLYKRGYAGLDNNGSGLMLAMGVPLLYFAWEFTKGWYRWGFLLVILPVVHAVVSSYSRGAMLALLLTTPLYLLFTRRRKFLLMCFAAVAALMPFMAGKEIEERFLSVQEAEADESFNSRLQSWGAAVRIASDYPVFGAGIRNANKLSHEYGADMEGRTIHSNYLQIAADTGWCGLVIYLALFGTAILSIWQARLRLWWYDDPESRRTVAMLGGIECAIWIFAVGSSALSMEVFELPYIMLFLGSQVWAIANASVSLDRSAYRPPPMVRVLQPPLPKPRVSPTQDTPPPSDGPANPRKLPTRADVSGPIGMPGPRRPG